MTRYYRRAVTIVDAEELALFGEDQARATSARIRRRAG
jgi:cobalamin biosynthesis protein CobT